MGDMMRCRYASCDHAPSNYANVPLCAYHEEGHNIVRSLEDAQRVMLEAKGHGLNASIDTLDVEIEDMKGLYRMEIR